MSSRAIPLILIATSLVACQAKTTTVSSLPTTAVTRGDVNVRVAATGVVEPINPVDVKSKASGMIIQLPVEVGSLVKKSDLLAQVDPRDVKNEYDQAVADDVVSNASLQAALRDRARKDSL
ncbi:MAG: biotin/lipoyl-binding protein, partial [Gemmatimonadaceae bacterium]